MAENEKKVLIDVIVNASTAIKEIAELRQKSADLKKEQKELDLSIEGNRERYEELALEIQANSKAIRDRQAAVQKAAQLEEAANAGTTDSLNALKTQISLATAAYDAMDAATRKSAKGQALQKFIKETTDLLKAEKKELGDTRLSVGDYQSAFEKALQTQGLVPAMLGDTTANLKTMQNELKALSRVSFEGLSAEEIARIKQAMADLKAGISDFNNEIKELDTGEVFANMANGLNTIVASATLVSNSLTALGVENETLEKLNGATVQLISSMQALGVITEFVEKQKYKAILTNLSAIKSTITETITRKLNALAISSEATAENVSTVAKTKGIIVTKLATAAQWLWNAAMAANPVLLIVIAIAALIIGIIALISILDKESAASIKAADAQRKYEQQVKSTEVAVAKLNYELVKATNERLKVGEDELIKLRQQGASKETLAKYQMQLSKDLRNIEIENLKAVRDEQVKQRDALARTVNAKQAELKSLDYGSKKYKEHLDVIKDLTKEYWGLAAAVENNNGKIVQLSQENTKSDLDERDRKIEAAKQAADKALGIALKGADQKKEILQSSMRTEAKYLSDDFLTKQDYARKEFKLNQDSEKEKLALNHKYKKITEQEYKDSLIVLTNQQTEFTNKQGKELNTYYSTLKDNVLSLFDKTIDDQIKDVEEKFKKVSDNIKDIKMPVQINQTPEEFEKEWDTYERIVLEAGKTQIQLEEEKNKQILELQKSYALKKAADITKIVENEYAGDIAKYSDNERKKLEVSITMLKELRDKKKVAGLETYEDEANIRAAEMGLIQVGLNYDLMKTGLTAEEKYNLKKAALEKELLLQKDNADAQTEINAQLLEAYQEMLNEQLAAFQEWSNATLELATAGNELFNALDDASLQKAQKTNETKKEDLQKRLDAGVISQEEFNTESKKLDEDLAAKEAEIARKKALREKLLKAFEIGINTASGIAKAVAASPLTFGLPFSAFVSATGALQLGAVLAQPLPKAARGILLNGPSHAQGGVPIEAEGGEAVINKKSTAMFLPLLSAINEMGGGIPFTQGSSDGGFAIRANQNNNKISYLDIEEAMTVAVEKVKVIVTVEDINRESKNYAEIQDRASY